MKKFWEIKAYSVSERKSFAADGEGDLVVVEGEEGRHVIGFAGEERRNGVEVVVVEAGEWVFQIELH